MNFIHKRLDQSDVTFADAALKGKDRVALLTKLYRVRFVGYVGHTVSWIVLLACMIYNTRVNSALLILLGTSFVGLIEARHADLQIKMLMCHRPE